MFKIAITGLRGPPYTPHNDNPDALREAAKKIASEWATEPLELHPFLVTLQFPHGREVLVEVRWRDGALFATLPAEVEAVVPKGEPK